MRIAFIGAGQIAEAMTAGIISSGFAAPGDIVASDPSRKRRDLLKRRHRISTTTSNVKAIDGADLVLLAVRPQDFELVLDEISGQATRKQLFVTIAAGIPISLVRKHLSEARVARVMPNLACLVSAAISAFTMGPGTTARDRSTVRRFLCSFGEALELPEEKFDAVTALSGSGPGFLTYFLREMVRGGVLAGLTEEESLRLATYTMYGTGKLLNEKDVSPDTFINHVASSKGTTAAGLGVLDKSSTRRAIQRTIVAAANRSKELSRKHS